MIRGDVMYVLGSVTPEDLARFIDVVEDACVIVGYRIDTEALADAIDGCLRVFLDGVKTVQP